MGWLQSMVAIVFGVYVLCGKADFDDHQFLAKGSHYQSELVKFCEPLFQRQHFIRITQIMKLTECAVLVSGSKVLHRIVAQN